ncbi:hypothetical protein OKW42_002538 [Paraburkholderia sp. WC7.3d]
MMIGARDQHRTRDRADGAGVVIGQDAAALHERIEVGRVDFAAERVNVGVAEVVGHDVKDVRPLLRDDWRGRGHGARRGGRGRQIAVAARGERDEARDRGADQAETK